MPCRSRLLEDLSGAVSVKQLFQIMDLFLNFSARLRIFYLLAMAGQLRDHSVRMDVNLIFDDVFRGSKCIVGDETQPTKK